MTPVQIQCVLVLPIGDKLTDDDLDFIYEHTNFEESAVRKQFSAFREECPNGKLTHNHLYALFNKLFPGGDSEIFCTHIFRIFDSDGNGFLVSEGGHL